MAFDIITTVSPDFAHGVPLFTPSWFRHSGAENIRFRVTPEQSWYESIIARNKHVRDAVIEAAGRRGNRRPANGVYCSRRAYLVFCRAR